MNASLPGVPSSSHLQGLRQSMRDDSSPPLRQVLNYVAQAGPNSLSSCLNLPTAGTTEVYHVQLSLQTS